jgi:hypothetical protein
MDVTHGLDRWLYRGNRPHLAARILNGAWARLAGAGFGPEGLVRLDVTGRRSGRTISFPVVVADYQGERYLASMLGEGSNWVKNVKRAGGRAVLRHRYRERVQLEDVPPGERAPILRRYLQCAPGARTHIPVDSQASHEDLEAAAAHIPIFRVRIQTTASVAPERDHL